MSNAKLDKRARSNAKKDSPRRHEFGAHVGVEVGKLRDKTLGELDPDRVVVAQHKRLDRAVERLFGERLLTLRIFSPIHVRLLRVCTREGEA